MPGPLELLLLVVVIALIFGARKLPELGKGMGQGIREFKREVKDPSVPTVTDVPSRPLDPAQPVADRDHRA